MRISLLFFLCLLSFGIQSFNDPYSKKRVTDKQFKYEFFTTLKKVRPKSNITYYWFKGGAIHTSEKGIAGELLNDDFDKFYLSNQLAEKGKFRKGKKVGVWRTWHPNGVLATEQEWAGGQRNGNFKSYNENGDLIEKGLYRADRKQGKWYNIITKDTLNYKNNKVVIKKVKVSKNRNSISPREEIKADKNNTKIKNTKSIENVEEKNVGERNKTSFFKRLFSKKNKQKSKNDKSQ